RLAQRKVSFRPPVIELGNRCKARMPQQKPPPHLEGKQLQIAAPIGKVVGKGTRATQREVHPAPFAGRRRPEARELERGRAFWLASDCRMDVPRDVGSRARPSHCKTFGKQLLVSQQHDGPRHPQFIGHLSGGRKLVAAGEDSTEDRLAKAQVNLAEERPAVFRKWYCERHKKWS